MARLRVSDRDLGVLLDLYNNVFLAFYQIKDIHFKNRAKPTVYNRLSKLTKSGLIGVLSVNLKAHHRHHEDVGVLYKITKQGLLVLKTYFPQITFRDEPAPINMGALFHDLILTDVLRKLKTSFRDCEIINSKVEQKTNGLLTKLPDAVMKNTKSGVETAIEIELTAKSEKRYRDIVLNYRMDSRFKNVLYIVSNTAIRGKIGGIVTGFKNNYKAQDDTGKFYFATIQNVFLQNSSINFDNGKNSFCTKPNEGMQRLEVI